MSSHIVDRNKKVHHLSPNVYVAGMDLPEPVLRSPAARRSRVGLHVPNHGDVETAAPRLQRVTRGVFVAVAARLAGAVEYDLYVVS